MHFVEADLNNADLLSAHDSIQLQLVGPAQWLSGRASAL